MSKLTVAISTRNRKPSINDLIIQLTHLIDQVVDLLRIIGWFFDFLADARQYGQKTLVEPRLRSGIPSFRLDKGKRLAATLGRDWPLLQGKYLLALD